MIQVTKELTALILLKNSMKGPGCDSADSGRHRRLPSLHIAQETVATLAHG
jgi:hypothetical protein